MSKPRSKLDILLAATFFTRVPIATGATYLGVQYLQGNFHEVEHSQLYREGQLNAAQIRD